MAQRSHNLALNEIPETLPELGLSNPGKAELTDLALDYLNQNFATEKEWSIDIGVSPALVNMWIRKKKPITEERAKQIIMQGEVYANRELRQIVALQAEALKLKGWF